VIFLDLSDRFRSFWETGIFDLDCTPLYSACTPLYSTRTPLVLYSYPGVLESCFFPLGVASVDGSMHVQRILKK
jgi:hypothetical protein